jgi:ABC-type iron transport system FetAB permease component
MKKSYLLAHTFIQAGTVGFMVLLLPFFGFLVGATFIASTMIITILAVSKMLVWVLLNLGLGLKAGIVRNLASMALSALLTLGVLAFSGFAVFDMAGWWMLFAILLLADLMAHVLLMSAGASRKEN